MNISVNQAVKPQNSGLATRKMTNVGGFILLVGAVTIMTWVLGLIDFKYKDHSTIAFADEFPGDLSAWERSGDWSNIEFNEHDITITRKTANTSFARATFPIDQSLDRSSHKLRVSGTVIVTPPVEGVFDDKGGSYMIWLYNSNNEVVRYLNIQEFNESKPTYDSSRIVNIPPEITSFKLVLNSRETTSELSLTEAKAEIITINNHYTIATYFILLLWFIVGAICFKWLIKRATWPLFISAGVLLVIIVIGVILPDALRTQYVDPIILKFASTASFTENQTLKIIYKTGHFLFFFLASFTLFIKSNTLSVHRNSLTILLVLFAIASEGMQLHLLDRNTRLFDLTIDISGILLAWILSSLVLSRTRNQ